MRATVALVRARPETIVEDYRRVLDLAGIDVPAGAAAPVLLAGRRRGGWFPGTGVPPWQLEGVGRRLRTDGPTANETPLLAVDPIAGGLLDPLGGREWTGTLARCGLQQQRVVEWEPAVVHPEQPLPALAAALPQGIRFPARLQGRNAVLLAVPQVRADWSLAGATALLSGLHGKLKRSARAPLSEVRAEALALARELIPNWSVVMDATVWSVARGRGTEPVGRNVLLAGDDPVAVDAVACRLAGIAPRTVPWLKLCRERGLGAVREDEIRIVGSEELLDLDFGIPPVATGPWIGGSGTDWSWRLWGRRRAYGKFRRGPWGRLYEEYRNPSGSPGAEGA